MAALDDIHVSARCLSGDLLASVRICPTRTIAELKRCILQEAGLYAKRLELTHEETEPLDDGVTLEEAGFREGTNVSVVCHDSEIVVVPCEHGNDNVVVFWDFASRRASLDLRGHVGEVTALAVDPEVSCLVSCSSDRTARLWSVSNGECMHILKGHTAKINCATFLKGAESVATGSNDGSARIWSVSDGQCLHTLGGHGYWLLSMASDPRLDILAVATTGNLALMYQLNSTQATVKLLGHRDWVNAVAVSNDAQVVATGSRDCTFRVWAITDGRCICVGNECTQPVVCVAFSHDGSTLFVASSECVEIWDWKVKYLKDRVYCGARVMALSVSSVSSRFASLSENGVIDVWSTDSWRRVRSLNTNSDDTPRCQEDLDADKWNYGAAGISMLLLP